MAVISSPSTLESFAESQLKDLLEAQLTLVPDVNILTGHTTEAESIDQESPVVVVTVQRQGEDIPGTGWWICDVEVELDPRDFTDTDIETTWLQLETALGDGGGDMETQITEGRLKCMAGSVFYDQAQEYDPTDGERIRFFRFSCSLGLTSS
tara:strand:+ start:92 stop:547 length:456 start_codon:yes stop_codon:yes gene_type:complete